MRIALLGYGKMGHEVERIALNRGHEIVLRVNKPGTDLDIKTADVAIDFSTAESAVPNISNCLKQGVPVVSGTTGWLKAFDTIANLCREREGAFLYASNFSLGVNIFFELNKELARLMANLEQYNPSITEIHHTEKRDAPSGTAISLAEDIISYSKFEKWTLDDASDKDSIAVYAKRVGDTPGTHHVCYSSVEDEITLSHKAHSRAGFALGAVIAAEWLIGRTGIFSMKDVLNIG